MGLVLLVLLLAVAGGFLGELLELAGWIILVLALAGASLGLLLYAAYRKVKARLT
jgi:hypothetical protein